MERLHRNVVAVLWRGKQGTIKKMRKYDWAESQIQLTRMDKFDENDFN